jgi:hypothetical protein
VVLIVEEMGANFAKQQAEKAVILVQGSLILSQGLNDIKILKRIIGDLRLLPNNLSIARHLI